MSLDAPPASHWYAALDAFGERLVARSYGVDGKALRREWLAALDAHWRARDGVPCPEDRIDPAWLDTRDEAAEERALDRLRRAGPDIGYAVLRLVILPTQTALRAGVASPRYWSYDGTTAIRDRYGTTSENEIGFCYDRATIGVGRDVGSSLLGVIGLFTGAPSPFKIRLAVWTWREDLPDEHPDNDPWRDWSAAPSPWAFATYDGDAPNEEATR